MDMQQILGSNPLTQSMMQSGTPLSALAQQTPSAATFNPDMQVPPFPPLPSKSPATMMGSAPQSPMPAPQQSPSQQLGVAGAAPQLGTPLITPQIYNAEAHRIIEALSKRLESITKAEQKGQRPPTK